ncbi:MAG: zinc metalloprotease, partial [Firmicutes bacterium]|nr:zinc metalloprotease [Bacillota bacterium]
DIENMMNEAALLTARRNGTIIHMDDLEEAITRVIAGPQKRSRVMSDKERRLTAYHEAGHAVVMRATPGSDPVHQVTIMPRGSAGGFTMQLPEEDHYYITRTEMEQDIMHLLGGRIAESLVLGDISTGASNDLERATKTAHDMVTKYGMSKAIGPINYSDSDEVFLGRDFTSKQNYSEELASKIDQEVRSIIDKAYADAEQLLKDHRAELDRVAEALLEMETLDADEFEAVYTGTKTVADLQAADKERSAARKVVEDAEAEARAKREAEENALSEALDNAINGRTIRKPPVRTRIARIDKDGHISVVGRAQDDAPKAAEEAEEKHEEDGESNE